MIVGVVANDLLKKEFLAQGLRDHVQVEWLGEPTGIPGANCYIDLLYQPIGGRLDEWKKMQPELIIVNSVVFPLAKIPGNVVRVNGWPGFLRRPLIEAACGNAALKENAKKIFDSFNRTTEWVPDIPGFISARVISMIINEAYFSLDEKVSSKEEIDIAMKLGTNYPFGPFEWSREIGLKNIYDLLTTLAHENSRYQPSGLLKTEALT